MGGVRDHDSGPNGSSTLLLRRLGARRRCWALKASEKIGKHVAHDCSRRQLRLRLGGCVPRTQKEVDNFPDAPQGDVHITSTCLVGDGLRHPIVVCGWFGRCERVIDLRGGFEDSCPLESLDIQARALERSNHQFGLVPHQGDRVRRVGVSPSSWISGQRKVSEQPGRKLAPGSSCYFDRVGGGRRVDAALSRSDSQEAAGMPAKNGVVLNARYRDVYPVQLN